jgi:prepilin signal peptidase PulO-like enzyme (type II secretory pathway)
MMILLVFIFGLAIGSFLNVVILRLHSQENFLKGRSHCPRCKARIAWYDNIPLASFVWLRGKCRHCKKAILWQYPTVEFICGILFVLAWYAHFGSTTEWTNFRFQISDFRLLRDWVFIAVLVVIFVYDLRWYLILDSITIPAIIVAFVGNLFLDCSFLNLAGAVIIGGGFFFLQFAVSKGKWIGGGDIRLGALMGAMLGFPQVLVALALAYFSGAIIGIGLLLAGKKQLSSKVPFGTFLSAATIVTLLYGEKVLTWYLRMTGWY